MSDLDALRTKYFELMLEAAGKDMTAEQRKSSATVVRTKADGTKEYKYPIPDVKHARLALSMIDQSDLSKGEKDKVRAKATSMLEANGKSMPPWMKKKDDESTEKEVPGSAADKAEDKAEGEKDDSKKMKGKMNGKMAPPFKKKEEMKEGGPMVPAGDALLPKKGGPKAKKDLMKEANGMVGAKAEEASPTNEKMAKDWEGAGDTGKTGDPKKKPVKAKGKSWLAKPPSSSTPVVPD
jgi:hypothetical protein